MCYSPLWILYNNAGSIDCLLNPRSALLFLRTRIALAGKKAPTRLIGKKTTNAFVQRQTLVFGHDEFNEMYLTTGCS